MTTLYYVHDPMCSWCWGFSKSWQGLLEALPDHIHIVRLLGGLAADSDEPMPENLQQSIASTWQHIQQQIPGVEFNFDFWTKAQPRRSTYPACRAVIAARKQGQQYDVGMTKAIQHAYYRQARNPSDESTLVQLAAELGLDVNLFKTELNSPATQSELLEEIQAARSLHADSFPSLILEHQGSFWPVAIDYNDYTTMLETVHLLTAN